MFGLGIIQRGLAVVRDLIGQPFREWSERADKNPGAAARQVEAIAVVLQGRADAIALRRGDQAWRVRRDRSVAKRLLNYAAELKAEARARELASEHRSSICEGFERVCIEAIEQAKKGAA
jgi:hypothetical protein